MAKGTSSWGQTSQTTRRAAIVLGASTVAGFAGWQAHGWWTGARGEQEAAPEVSSAFSDQNAVGSRLPSWVVGSYWQPYTFEKVADVPDSFDMVTIGFVHGVGEDDVQLDLGPVSWDDVTRVCQERRADGQKWLVSVGGGANLAQLTPILTKQAAKKVADYLSSLVDQLHISGIDLDLESGPAGYDEESVLWLCAELKRRHGDHFLVTAAPRPFEIAEADQTWGSVLAHGVQKNLIDFVTIQFYDTDAAATPEAFLAWADRTFERAQTRGLPSQSVLVGVKPALEGEPGMTVAETVGAVARLRTRYGVRGVNLWHVGRDSAHDGAFSQGLKALGEEGA